MSLSSFAALLLSAFLTNWWKRPFCPVRITVILSYLIPLLFLKRSIGILVVLSCSSLSFQYTFLHSQTLIFQPLIATGQGLMYLLQKYQMRVLLTFITYSLLGSLLSFKSGMYWSTSTCFLASSRIWLTRSPFICGT